MSCSTCHFISGHDPSCRHFHEDAAAEQSALRERVEALERSLADLRRLVETRLLGPDQAHLMRLYAESRDYVRALERERDDLVEAAKQHVIEVDQLDTLVERMRPVYEAAKQVRASTPVATAAEMRDRGFHATSCDLIEAVDRAVASEPTSAGPYREKP